MCIAGISHHGHHELCDLFVHFLAVWQGDDMRADRNPSFGVMLWAVAVATALFGMRAAYADGTRPTTDFSAVPPNLRRLLDALDARQRSMLNVHYKVDVDVINRPRGGGMSTSLGRTRFTVDRLGSLLRLTTEVAAEPPDRLVTQTWDGSHCRSFALGHPSSYPASGAVRAAMPFWWVEPYKIALCWRMQFNLTVVSPYDLMGEGDLAGVLRTQFGWRGSGSIRIENDKGPIWQVRCTDLFGAVNTWELDASKDWALVSWTDVLDPHGKRGTVTTLRVPSWIRVNNQWLPASVVLDTDWLAQPTIQTATATLIEASVGALKASDFDVVYPAGSIIIDEVDLAAYTALEGGVVRPEEFTTPAFSTALTSTPAQIVRSLDDCPQVIRQSDGSVFHLTGKNVRFEAPASPTKPPFGASK
jgi:hypothetical protein